MRHALLLSACLLPCAAQAATFQSFDVPGAYGTCGSAIASNGLVAGSTVEPYVIGMGNAAPAEVVTPFLYAAGHLSYPKTGLPAGLVTFAGVNSDRFIVGNDFNGDILNPINLNFLYHQGKISTLSAGTLPISGLSGITDRGVILGQGTVITQLGGGFTWSRTIGFVRAVDGTVSTIDDGSSLAMPRGMDARADQFVGYSFATGITGWLYKAGIFTPITFPGSSFTMPAGVNEAGLISGTYLVGNLTPAGNAVSHGFFLRNGAYSSYDVPVKGVTATNIGAMNEAGQITGCYTDAKGIHGFIRTP